MGKVEKLGGKFFGLDLYANDKCVSCKKCMRDCPSKNIEFKNNKPKFKFNCGLCLKCIYECPQKAISPRMSKFLVIKDGYKKVIYKEEK